MKTSDFYYDLPEELIAQTPVEPRNSSRLMVLPRNGGKIEHKHFYDLPEFLKPGDCLVLNNTRVLPARLYGTREDTGAVVEFVLLRQHGNKLWECLAGPGKKAKTGYKFRFSDKLTATVTDVLEDGNRMLEFACEGDFFAVLDGVGQMPLPPYIKEKLKDKERYQTVYSKDAGSAAAPTAGLHFTPELLDRIRAKGIDVVPVLLHVGLGTFRPVKEEHIEDHEMHTEHWEITPEAADRINAARANGHRIVCVGTTSVRTLESASTDDGIVHAGSGDTSIFIYPGYKYKAVDALITNFHLPGSTLVMLVSAFMGRENALSAYKEAVEKEYRFFSFGDAMFIY